MSASQVFPSQSIRSDKNAAEVCNRQIKSKRDTRSRHRNTQIRYLRTATLKINKFLGGGGQDQNAGGRLSAAERQKVAAESCSNQTEELLRFFSGHRRCTLTAGTHKADTTRSDAAGCSQHPEPPPSPTVVRRYQILLYSHDVAQQTSVCSSVTVAQDGAAEVDTCQRASAESVGERK